MYGSCFVRGRFLTKLGRRLSRRLSMLCLLHLTSLRSTVPRLPTAIGDGRTLPSARHPGTEAAPQVANVATEAHEDGAAAPSVPGDAAYEAGELCL